MTMHKHKIGTVTVWFIICVCVCLMLISRNFFPMDLKIVLLNQVQAYFYEDSCSCQCLVIDII